MCRLVKQYMKQYKQLVSILFRLIFIKIFDEIVARYFEDHFECLALAQAQLRKPSHFTSLSSSQAAVFALCLWRPILSVLFVPFALRLKIDFQNRFAFEDEVQNALHLLVEKHRVGTGSIQEVLCSHIAARDILLEEIQHWIATIKRRLTPRMKAHNAWQIEFKRDIPIQVFSLFLKAVRKARSAVHLACPTQKQKKQFLFSTQRRSV